MDKNSINNQTPQPFAIPEEDLEQAAGGAGYPPPEETFPCGGCGRQISLKYAGKICPLCGHENTVGPHSGPTPRIPS